MHLKDLMSFRCDRRTDLQDKNKSGGILFMVPKNFQLEVVRNDVGDVLKVLS